MSFLVDVLHWLSAPEQWHGENGIPHRALEHAQISAVAVLGAFVLAVPLGVVLGHVRRGGLAAITVANIGRAVPSFAILVLFVQQFGIGFRPTFIALLLLAIPPMLTNSYVALEQVDDDVREAARGMGMTGRQALWRAELPAASPVIMAGVRTAAVQVVATATLAAVVAWGGLGRYVVDGIATRDEVKTFSGALLVVALVVLTEALFAVVERIVVPRSLRRATTLRRAAGAGVRAPARSDGSEEPE